MFRHSILFMNSIMLTRFQLDKNFVNSFSFKIHKRVKPKEFNKGNQRKRYYRLVK